MEEKKEGQQVWGGVVFCMVAPPASFFFEQGLKHGWCDGGKDPPLRILGRGTRVSGVLWKGN